MSEPPATGAASRSLGFWSLVSGLVAIFGVLMIGQASFEWVQGFDPADWLRVATGWMIPLGCIAAIMFGVLSLRRGSGRSYGIVGIVLAIATVAIFIAYLVTHPY